LGLEFGSRADVISFGAASAFLVPRVVLRDVFSSSGKPVRVDFPWRNLGYIPTAGWRRAHFCLCSGVFEL